MATRQGQSKSNPRVANGNLRRKQREYWKHRGLPCAICGQKISYDLGYVVDEVTGKKYLHPMAFVIDEIIPVSRWREGGYSSPEACAQDLSNQRPVHALCNLRRGDGTRGSGIVHVVSGAPCSGKTTFVRENKSEGDVVIDMDAIAKALGYMQDHGAKGNYLRVALAARQGAINEVLRKRCGAWIIHTKPKPEDVTRYETCGAIFHVCDPGIEVCLQRAEADDRPEGTADAIRKWYGSDSQRLTRLVARKPPKSIEQPFADW